MGYIQGIYIGSGTLNISDYINKKYIIFDMRTDGIARIVKKYNARYEAQIIKNEEELLFNITSQDVRNNQLEKYTNAVSIPINASQQQTNYIANYINNAKSKKYDINVSKEDKNFTIMQLSYNKRKESKKYATIYFDKESMIPERVVTYTKFGKITAIKI